LLTPAEKFKIFFTLILVSQKPLDNNFKIHLKLTAMITVHDTFVCKPGNASKVAKLFKEVMVDNTGLVHIMTDLTGDYNRVIMVSQYESLSAYEQNFQKYMQDTDEMKKMKEKMMGYHELYLTGSREIFQIW
jgi:hypothetical protein